MLIVLGIIAYLAVGIVLFAALFAFAEYPPDSDLDIALLVAIWPLCIAFLMVTGVPFVLSETVKALSEYLRNRRGRPGVGDKPDPGGIDEESP